MPHVSQHPNYPRLTPGRNGLAQSPPSMIHTASNALAGYRRTSSPPGHAQLP